MEGRTEDSTIIKLPPVRAAPAPAALPPSAEAPVRRRNVRAVRRQSAKASVRRVTTPVRSRLEEEQARVAASRRSPVLTDPALVENLAAGGESAAIRLQSRGHP